MSRDANTAQDRRIRQRFGVNAPLAILIGDREVQAYTRDISDSGVYFYLAETDGALIDRNFEFVLQLPAEITQSSCCQIRCQGRTLRMEKTPMGLAGVAAEILDYSILAGSALTDSSLRIPRTR
jgi:PilZ domain